MPGVISCATLGPAQLLFPVATRPKPDVAAFDTVTTTVAGFTPFAGTSSSGTTC